MLSIEMDKLEVQPDRIILLELYSAKKSAMRDHMSNNLWLASLS